MGAILNFFNSLLSQLPNVIFTILLLLVAFVAASIVKSLVKKLLKAVKADSWLSKFGIKDATTGSPVDFVAKLAYFITFLLFLPGVLDRLGMQSVSAPITNMVNAFLGFVPNMIAAIIIIAVGVFVAKIVKELLIPVLKAIKVDALQEKAGIDAEEKTSFSTIIANVVYGVIILVVITAALEQLGIAAISNPANVVVAKVFEMIPNVLGAIIIIAIGVFIAKLVSTLLETLLAGVGADTLLEKVTGEKKKLSLSKVIGVAVKYVLVIVFIVQGVNVLNLPILTNIGAAIISYMPAVLSAIIIVAIGMFAAGAAEGAVLKKKQDAKAMGLAIKVAIYVITAFVCLSQLGVAKTIVETTFILIVAAVCVAFAIAFGVGGRKFAADNLEKLEKKLENKDK